MKKIWKSIAALFVTLGLFVGLNAAHSANPSLIALSPAITAYASGDCFDNSCNGQNVYTNWKCDSPGGGWGAVLTPYTILIYDSQGQSRLGLTLNYSVRCGAAWGYLDAGMYNCDSHNCEVYVGRYTNGTLNLSYQDRITQYGYWVSRMVGDYAANEQAYVCGKIDSAPWYCTQLY